jgi:hypothetical protein
MATFEVKIPGKGTYQVSGVSSEDEAIAAATDQSSGTLPPVFGEGSDVPQVGRGPSSPRYEVPLLDRAKMGPDSRPIEDRLAGLKQTHPEAQVIPGNNGEPIIVVWDKANRQWVSANPKGLDVGDVAAYGRVAAEGLGGGLGALAGAFGAAPTGMMAAPVSVPLGTGIGATAAGQAWDSGMEYLGRKDSRGLLERATDTATEVPLQALGAKAGDAVANFVRGKGKDYLQSLLGVVKQTVDPATGMIAPMTKGQAPSATLVHEIDAEGIPLAGAAGSIAGGPLRSVQNALLNLPGSQDATRGKIFDTIAAVQERLSDTARGYGQPKENIGAWSEQARKGLIGAMDLREQANVARHASILDEMGRGSVLPLPETRGLLSGMDMAFAQNPTSNAGVDPARGMLRNFLANEATASSGVPGIAPETVKNVLRYAEQTAHIPPLARKTVIAKYTGLSPDQVDSILNPAGEPSAPNLVRLGEADKMRKLFSEHYSNPAAGNYLPAQAGNFNSGYNALAQDIQTYADSLGTDVGGRLMRQRQLASDTFADKKALGSTVFEDPAALGKALTSAMHRKTGSKEDFDLIQRSLPEADWQRLKATLVENMGKANPGAQGAEGDGFSPRTFLTNLNNLAPYARDALFNAPGEKETGNRLARLARINEALEKTAAETNTSRTAPTTLWMRIMQGGNLPAAMATMGVGGLGHAAAGIPGALAGAAVGGVAALTIPAVMGRALMNPTFVRFLVSQPAKTQAGLASQVMRLGASLAAKQDTPPEVLAAYEEVKKRLLGRAKRAPAP